MRVLTQFAAPAARTIAERLPGRTLRGLMRAGGYGGPENVVLFFDDERLAYDPFGLEVLTGYRDPGSLKAMGAVPEPRLGQNRLVDKKGHVVIAADGAIASCQLVLDLAKERDRGDDRGRREQPMVARVIFEIRLENGAVFELSTDGTDASVDQVGGF